MKDGFGRTIDYLRVSVTDRCNLRCRYCMPPSGITHVSNGEILTYEEIAAIVEACGITKVRITGGEPLVRRDIVDLVKRLDVEDFSMTTNGILLKDYAESLKEAGLKRINISLDTLNRERFRYITGSDSLDSVLDGIQTAMDIGLFPVKINVLLLDRDTLGEVRDFVKLTIENPIHVRFIEFMPIRDYKGSGIYEKDVLHYSLEPASVEGNGPARYFRLKGTMGTIGFISPMTNKFCKSCNRLRLTSTGFLKSCLHSNVGVNLRDPIRNGVDIRPLIERAVGLKPKEHHLEASPIDFMGASMCQIGG